MGSFQLSRRAMVASVVAVAALVVCAATPQLLGSQIQRAFAGLGSANPLWLALACAAFASSIFCSAQSWRTAAGTLGGAVGRRGACARFTVGALVNAVAPAKLGEAVRVALFAQVLPAEGRTWSAAGLFGAIGVARALVISATVVAASAIGALPLWPVFALAGTAFGIVGAATIARRRAGNGRLARLLDALAVFVASPRASARILAWSAGVSIARIAAAAAAAAALGVHDPLTAALIMVPALDLAGTLPLTPGNVGVASGAVALALRAHGIDTTTALATGIAFHAAECLVGITCGVAGLLAFTGVRRIARPPRPVLAGVGVVCLGAVALACALAGLG